MNIKDIFDNAEEGTLTYEQFEALAKDKGAKFTDLSDGKYVSKSKYEADLKAKDADITSRDEQIENLNTTIATRDTDLANLQTQLEEAGNDATKLADLSASFTDLQSKYDNDIKDYENKMQQQAYEFAVREFANGKKFTSNAAKRDFTQAMIARGLQMDGNKLIGGDDFVAIYSEENADAFAVDKPTPEPTPTPNPEPTPEPVAVPTFVASTPGPVPNTNDDGGFQFNFTGVRAHE